MRSKGKQQYPNWYACLTDRANNKLIVECDTYTDAKNIRTLAYRNPTIFTQIRITQTLRPTHKEPYANRVVSYHTY